MKSLRLLPALCGTAALMTLLAGLSSPAQADISFHVALNTGPLTSSFAGNAPFSVLFQLIDGDGIANNTANIQNITFGGGSAGGNITTLGGAVGNLGSGLTLSDPDPGFIFNAFYQEFTPGSTLAFDVSLSTNFAGGTPDSFSFAVLDNSGFEIPSSGLTSEFVRVDLTGPTSTVESYSAQGSYAALGSPTVNLASTTTAPEPSPLALLGLALPLVLRIRRSQKA